MENNSTLQNLLFADKIPITENLTLRIPTVKDVLEDEENYYSIVSAFTGSPYQYMVYLDSLGVNYTTTTDYDLFIRLFLTYKEKDLSLFFGDMDMTDFKLCANEENSTLVFKSLKYDITIDELVYHKMADALRKINSLHRDNRKPGNDEAARYALEQAKKKYMRNLKKPYKSFFEPMVIALVNRPEFKYDYSTVMDLSIYMFNQSFKQIETGIRFDNMMRGIYSGTVDSSKIQDKASLSWIQTK